MTTFTDAEISTTADRFVALFNNRPPSVGLQVQGSEFAYAVDKATQNGDRVVLTSGQIHYADDEIITREMCAGRDIRVRVRTYDGPGVTCEDRMRQVRAILAKRFS